MARFVYHSQASGNVVAIVAFGTLVAAFVLTRLLQTPRNPCLWHFVFFGMVVVLAVLGPALYRFIDRRTRRVRKVMPIGHEGALSKKSVGTAKANKSADKPSWDEQEWEIGPRGLGHVPYWIGTLLTLGLAALELRPILGLSPLPRPLTNEAPSLASCWP